MKGGENSGPEPRNAGGSYQWAEQLELEEQVGSTGSCPGAKFHYEDPLPPRTLLQETSDLPGASVLRSWIYFLNSSTEHSLLAYQILLHNSVSHKSPLLALPLFLSLVAQSCSTYFILHNGLAGCLYVCFSHSPGSCLRVESCLTHLSSLIFSQVALLC